MIMGLMGNKGYTPSYVLMQIENCISAAETASQSKVVVDKLYEATKFISQLEEMEKKGVYKSKPSSKEYAKAFVNKKDKILMDGIKRAYAAGETKEEILKNRKFYSDELIAFIENL
jgi:hypothetical protein